MPRYLQDLPADDPLNKVYYTTVSFFGSSIEIPRPSQEARSELRKLAGSSNAEANLYRLLAEQDERVLDLAAAEANLQTFVARSADKPAAFGVLADFYQRHLRFDESVATLLKQAEVGDRSEGIGNKEQRIGDGGANRLQDRLRYRALHRAIDLIESRRLPGLDALAQSRKLIEWYPEEPMAWRELLAALVKGKQPGEALALLERYRQKFPRDPEYALHTQAQLLEAQGNPSAALEVYSRNYQPRWSDSLANGYLALLRRTGRFESFAQSLGQRLKQDPLDFASVTLLFRGTLNQGNLEAARNALFHFRTAKETRNQPFSEDELETLAHYFCSLNHFNEGARYFSTLALQARDSSKKEEALYQLHQVMIDALNRPTQMGGSSLDYYKSVAEIDTSPGLLNGMLSLILNRTHPRLQMEAAEERAVPYFNRARAAELLEFFEKSYPNSARLPRMQYRSLEALKAYGRWETITQKGGRFLERYPNALETPAVGLLMADAFANLKNEAEEFKVYSRLLDALNARPHRFWLRGQAGSSGGRGEGSSSEDQATTPADAGSVVDASQAFTPSLSEEESHFSSAVRDRAAAEEVRLRSLDYSYVLERTVVRLTAARRYLDVVALFRKELERNSGEEALYVRFAEYLNQHRFFQEEMETYQQALNRFNTSGWYDKLARWYLRQRRQADFAALSKKFVDAFKGTELESYFAEVVNQVRPQAFYEELNLYASRRFPHNLVFARNLADLYASASRTYPQWEAIAQKYFFEDKQIRERYYSTLSRQGRLQPMLAELAAFQDRNLAQTRFLADALAWRSQFEDSAPHYQLLASRYPAEPETVNLASDILRSLGAYNPQHTTQSAKLRESLATWSPDDRETLTRIGETYADIEAYNAARQAWQRIPAINVSDRGLHLEAATLSWDYYLFDDSLRAIQEYRRLSGEPSAMAYEVGAIYEDQKAYPRVIEEYVQAAAMGTAITSGQKDDYDYASSTSTAPGENSGPFIPSSAEDGSSYVTGGDERASQRLRFLERRRQMGSAIDAEFQKRIQSDTPAHHFALAYSRHLDSLRRFEDLRTFLLERVSAAEKRDFLNRVQPLLQQHGFFEVQEAGLKRLIVFATASEMRVPLELELARFYEGRNRIEEARAALERLHAADPKSLGLIQDLEAFYWRHQLRDQAVALLERSVPLANANYRRQFLFDQAGKLAALKQYERAIATGKQLLQENPLDSTYAAFVASTFALAERHAELPAFYTAQLQAIRQSALVAEEKKTRTLAFRRGMIEAQVVLKDFAAAVDQYVEMINASSEDTATVNEAADFAREHQLERRLRDYYLKTAQQSPRDHRWPLVLGRLEDRWGQLRESLTQYEVVLRLRPERLDLHEAKGELEQRLLDFPASVQTFSRLYSLSYKNPAYLLRVAELQARLGSKAEALDAFKKAYAADSGLPAAQYFKMAESLNRWGYLDEAKPLIDEGWKRFKERSASDVMGGTSLLLSAIDVSVQRRDAENTFHALRAEYKRLDGIKDQPGGAQAHANLEILRRAFLDLGKAIDKYFTPEEKAGFQGFLEKIQPPLSVAEKEVLVLKLVEAAGLPDLWESLLISIVDVWGQQLTASSDANEAAYRRFHQQLVEFYRHRQAYEKASASLVALWERNPQRQRFLTDLMEPAVAARKLGNASLEMSILEKYARASGGLFSAPVLERYYELLGLLNQEARILQISQTDNRLIPALVNVLIDRNRLDLARTVIRNYGRRSRTPAWTTTQLAMTGSYLKDTTPQMAAAFESVLNLKPVGELLEAAADDNQFTYGAEWYFYACSYGEHLYRLKDPLANEYLMAQLEFSPVSEYRQSQLGSFYLKNGELLRALARFEQAVELEPSSLEALDGQAEVWMKQGQVEKAQANWLKLLTLQEERFSLPSLQRVLARVREFKLEAAFRQPVETLLKTYVKRNQAYGIAKVLPSAMRIFGTAEEKTALLKTLAGDTQTFPFVVQLLQLQAVQAAGLPLESVYEGAIEWQQAKLNDLGGEDRSFQQNQLHEFMTRFAEYLLKSRSDARVETLLDALLKERESAAGPSGSNTDPLARRIQFLRAQLYLKTNRAELAKTLLQSLYRSSEPIESRRDDYLKAAELFVRARMPVAARAVREELYRELIRSDSQVNASHAGLAEVYLEGKRPALALAALQRMLHSRVDNEEGYRLAAQLLWRYRSTKLDAASTVTLGDKTKDIWRDLLKLNPFPMEARLQLAESLGKAGAAESQNLLKAVLEARQSTYQQKAEAARIAGKTALTGITYPSAELRFIAGLEAWRSTPTPTTPQPALPELATGYYGPLYAMLPGTPPVLPPMEALRHSLYVRTFESGANDAMQSQLFAGLIRFFERAKQPGLLVDLFEQHGGTFRSKQLFGFRQAEADTVPDGNPLEEPGTDSPGPQPLTPFALTVSEKVVLMKSVIAAYSTLEADDLAAEIARSSASVAAASRQAFLNQAQQLEAGARQRQEAFAARFAVNDTLGEDLSQRRPLTRPRGRVRS